MPKSPEEMADAMIVNMKEKTGKTLPQWIRVARESGFAKHGEIVKHLKIDHGMTHGFANLVAHKTNQSDASSSSKDSLVSAQYAGPKADLRTIYDALIARVARFGDDVEIAPKKTYVSLRRNKQFAIIQPSTKTRIDVGVNLRGEPSTERLETSGSFNSMVSHRVRVEEKKHVDKELVAWLKKAYLES